MTTTTDGGPRRTPLARLRRHWLVLAWLLVLWLLLWGVPLDSPLVLLAGVAVAVGVVALFPMPSLSHHVTVRPVGVLRLVGHVLVNLVGSATTVAWETLSRGPRARTGIVAVPLHADNDLLVSATAHLTTLIPGTLVVELDRERLLLYVHALPLRDAREADRRRADAWHAERLTVGAWGTTAQRRACGDAPRGDGHGGGDGGGR